MTTETPTENDDTESRDDQQRVVEDDASKAAIALAAVAAAATANNLSPSAAGEAARALAPDLVPEAAISSHRTDSNEMIQQKIDRLGLDRVRENFKGDGSVRERLRNGENDFFIEHLLALQNVAVDQDTDQTTEALLSDTVRAVITEGVSKKAVAIMTEIESVYASFESMLPPVNIQSQTEVESRAIPDLLPPCKPHNGDATTRFFDACEGELSLPTQSPQQTPQTNTKTEPQPNWEKPISSDPVVENKRPSILSTVISSMASTTSPSRANLFNGYFFRKQGLERVEGVNSSDEGKVDESTGDYTVVIEKEMLGLTVENVLEHTVVRTVLPNSAAKRAGAKVGSLIVKVGIVSTNSLTHFETIDELRQSQRPLRLTLRQIAPEILRSAREEMGRLIRGEGFRTALACWKGGKSDEAVDKSRSIKHELFKQAPIGRTVRQRWVSFREDAGRKRLVQLLDAGENLIWVLTLLVYGLERDSSGSNDSTDAAKSVSKILLDFVSFLLFENSSTDQIAAAGAKTGANVASINRNANGTKHQSQFKQLLMKIGNVLKRTSTFLADPNCPSAALLRGEIIAILIEILDVDTEMDLVEEEATSNQGSAESIVDLGSAGSLLKLIVLTCLDASLPDGDVTDQDGELSGDELQLESHWQYSGNRFLAIVHRLAASVSKSARITACSMGPVLWGHLEFPYQLQLRGVITRALHDVNIVVRKSAAHVLHEIAELVFDPRSIPWLILMCERAMSDPEPQLRAAAMTLTCHMSEKIPDAFLLDTPVKKSGHVRRLPSKTDPKFAEVYLLQCKLLPVATRLADDESPSVRLAVAAQCDRLCSALGDHWHVVILDMLQALLADTDEEVRSEAILSFPRLAEIILCIQAEKNSVQPAAMLQTLLPMCEKLKSDPCKKVRMALALASGELLTLLVGLEASTGTDTKVDDHRKVVDESLIPLLQKLLHDEEPEVTSAALRAVTNASRSTATKNSGMSSIPRKGSDSSTLSSASSLAHSNGGLDTKGSVFNPLLSDEQILSLLPTLSKLACSKQWRVRHGAVEIVPALLGCTQNQEIISDIAKLCLQLMNDRVAAVRQRAAECFCNGGVGGLSNNEGALSSWVAVFVIPCIEECSQSGDIKQRMLSLKMITLLLVKGGIDKVLQQKLLSIAIGLKGDNTANVRLMFGRLAAAVCGTIKEDETSQSLLSGALEEQLASELADESRRDRDVIYFAKLARDELML